MAGTFSLDISKWADKAKGDLDQVTRQVVFEMASRIIVRSPVDTGRFRGNWAYEVIGTISKSAVFETGAQLQKADPGGQVTLGRILAAIPPNAWGKVHRLSNSLPYAVRLEYGHSKQAPAGMVRITAAEFGSIVSDEAQAVRP